MNQRKIGIGLGKIVLCCHGQLHKASVVGDVGSLKGLERETALIVRTLD